MYRLLTPCRSLASGNRQPCSFLVLNDADSLAKLQKACNSHGAPLAILVCADKHTAWVRPADRASMAEIDTSIATDHMMLCAQDLGLSTCWITYFKPDALREQFRIPEQFVPVNILAIGYGAEAPSSPERFAYDRKPMEQLVKYLSF